MKIVDILDTYDSFYPWHHSQLQEMSSRLGHTGYCLVHPRRQLIVLGLYSTVEQIGWRGLSMFVKIHVHSPSRCPLRRE